MKLKLEQGRDRLLEMHSNGGEVGVELGIRLQSKITIPDLVNFALNLFDIVGINQEDRSDSLIVLTPSDHIFSS